MIEFAKKISKLFDSFYIEYLIVGGVALMLYSKKTQTKDLDIIVLMTKENLKRFENVISDKKLLSDFKENKIIRIIGKPFSIDFHPKLDGVNEIQIFKNYSLISVGDCKLKVINQLDLNKNLETVKNNINGIIRTQI